ncbi:MAG: tetratricopeptide repeat protein [Spirochaetaceae bacterium]|nr:MAG: tetratricopeptide repeat protein [Spirochaetaceae bacterium]
MIAVPLPPPDKRTLEREYRAARIKYESMLEEFRRDMSTRFRRLEIDPAIKVRVKSFESYYKKLMARARSLGPDAESVEISDFLGVRVVCPFLEDLRVIEQQLRSAYRVVEVERKGAEYSVREFGYSSIHYLIQIPMEMWQRAGFDEVQICEVQVRTILQDAWAEVEHELIYKNEFSPFDEPLRRKLAALNANLSLSDIIFQEIREYQRQLQSELRKRRRGFHSKVAELNTGDGNGQSTGTRLANGLGNFPGPGNSIDAFVDEQNPLEIYQSAIVASGGDSVDNLLLQALLAHNSGDLERAVELYGRILQHDPKPDTQAVILVHRGMAEFSRAKYEEAIRDFTKTLELDSTNVKALYYRGTVFRMMGQHGESLADLDRCIDIDPYQFDGLYARAQLRYELGDYALAMADCDRAIALDPDLPELSRFRALITEAVGKTL